MTHARLIIDAEGLPHAKGYYSIFPHEPSPEGELEVTDVDTVASSEPRARPSRARSESSSTGGASW
jgi:hypothetical protein